ncbi:PEGA domain-containing protein [Candidatus Daviesbacteria bacterium]|nr:PEGA domain-containing protein [Candidatus Daviesbacteria bacterium]
MSKRFLFTILTLVLIAVIGALAIFLAKGYTFSTKEKRIVGTGILTITSEPDAASVFIDGHLTTATNTTIASLAPKDYTVKIVKEGLIPWERKITIKEGLVTDIKVRLFPAIPTIYPLTFSGITAPVLSPDNSKLAYIVPMPAKKAGIWIWTQSRSQPISFARSAEPHQIAQSQFIDFSKATLQWSADSKQIIAKVGANNYLLDAEKLNTDPRDITPMLDITVKDWEEDARSQDESLILAIKDTNLRRIASASATVRWSPDGTKFMARKEKLTDKDKGKVIEDFKVYDIDERKEYPLPAARSHVWLPDSRHIILVEDQTISIVDFDGTNKAVIYAGSFQDNFVFPWLDSSRLAIITSFPTPTASEPNLYGINLK